jgi:hypothetical protein
MRTGVFVKGMMAGVSIALLSGSVGASSFNVGLSNKTIEAGLKLPFGTSAQVSANYLKSDDQGKIYELGLQTVQHMATHSVSLGGKYVDLNSDTREDGHVFALGGDYRRPLGPQLSLAFSVDYAPSVLSSSGIDRYYRLDGKLMYQVMPTADVYVGYRDIHFKFDNLPDQTVEQGLYVGADLRF